MIIKGEELPEEVKLALIDRFEAWEIVEFLGISTEQIVNLLEEELVDNIEDVVELVGLRNEDEDDD